MKTISSLSILLLVSYMSFAQSWGTTIPQVTGGYDVQYIPELNTTYGSGGGNVVTLHHDTVTSSMVGPLVNKFRYYFDTLFAATNGTNSFRFLDTTWNAVPNVTLDASSFYLDTLGINILILSESSEPYPGHVIQYNGIEATTIPGLDVFNNSDHSVTYAGMKFISYTSSSFEPHLLAWNGTVSLVAQVPDNYGIANLFVKNSKLYATLILLGIYQLWEYDGSVWQYVLQFPAGFNCQGAFKDGEQAVYFFGSKLYKCVLPDTTVTEIENPITNTIYAMTKDTKTGIYYLSSNFIFWWNGKPSVATGLTTPPPSTTATFNFDMATNTLSVNYDGPWAIFNCLGQKVDEGNGITTKNLSHLASGTYILSSKEMLWSHNKFLITR